MVSFPLHLLPGRFALGNYLIDRSRFVDLLNKPT